MTSLVISVFLGGLVVSLAIAAGMRSRATLRDGSKEGLSEFLRMVPRVGIGIIGSGYLAAILPQDLVASWLGPQSGTLGVGLATIAGALTPGGPVIGFALGTAALKGGAGAPQIIAYVTAWALYAFPRIMIFELPMLPARYVWIRVAASLPLPFLAAAGAMLIGRP